MLGVDAIARIVKFTYGLARRFRRRTMLSARVPIMRAVVGRIVLRAPPRDGSLFGVAMARNRHAHDAIQPRPSVLSYV